MKDNAFWEKNQNHVAAIVDTIDRNSRRSFIWVTNVKTRESWCSSKLQDLLGLDGQMHREFERILIPYVHPRELGRYREKMNCWLEGRDLQSELEARVHDANGDYRIVSMRAKPVYGADKELEYLVISMENETIFPKFDPVTNLYTYTKYVTDLKERLTEFKRLALLQIQIEGFNTFNLIYGVDYSSRLLREIGHKFIGMMDMQKAVYHMEGERFVFILKDAGREDLTAFEQQIRKALAAGVMLDGKNISLKIGAGGILLDHYQGDSSSARGQVAYALDHSMHQHQGQLVVFNDEVQTSKGENLTLMRAIHQSVQNGCDGFYVEYQPIVVAQTGEFVGAEALVRWKKEPYGIIPPGRFIEWMETDPSMYDLGNFVLRKAFAEMKELIRIKPHFFVNVNVSVRQLERMEFHEDLMHLLEEAQFPPECLCLELTERCKDFPLEKLQSEVAFFQSRGIRVAMDDYGTGSASSSIIMNIPMDEIKLDMSFIRNIRESTKKQEMVRSIVSFANHCNIDTCVEGVEDEELQNYLRSYDVTWFQGYYYARPIAAHVLKEMVEHSCIFPEL